MKLKKGDKVKVISGKSKNSVAIIKEVITSENCVVLEGTNMGKKHVKPTQVKPEGGVIEFERKINVSNVMLVDPLDKNKVTKVGYEISKGKKYRIAKKSKERLN